jgi:hypothetical protein
LLECFILFGLLQYAVSNDQEIKLISHEAAELLEPLEQPVKHWVFVRMHSLDTRRIIDMCYRRNFRSHMLSLSIPKKRSLFGSHGATTIFAHIRDD